MLTGGGGAWVALSDVSLNGYQVEEGTELAIPTRSEYSVEFQVKQTAVFRSAWVEFFTGGPRQELLDRLNARLKGRPLGSPRNWKGLPDKRDRVANITKQKRNRKNHTHN